jgi:hypothetical protein
MKKIFFVMLLHCIGLSGFAQKNDSLPNGIYLVDSINPDRVLLQFDAGFVEETQDHAKSITVFRTDFVPLELDSVPACLRQIDKSQRLQVYFSASAAKSLEAFTGKHLMRQAVIVVDGKALTVQKIRAKIVGGKLEISRSGDDVCEQLHARLKTAIRH